MASKLFRAVVGFGIGLGATTAACFGATDAGIVGTTAENVPDGSTSKVPAPSSSTSSTDPGPTSTPPPKDASSDVHVHVADAAADAPKDVGADAFCDAAWPTTKGNPKPPACTDPNNECVDAGAPGYCVPVSDAGTCEWGDTYAPFCVNKEWRCQSGTIDWGSCQ
jgi:hypothetical protein